MIEKEEARSTVKSLADSVIPSPPSGIGDKIIKRRRERYYIEPTRHVMYTTALALGLSKLAVMKRCPAYC